MAHYAFLDENNIVTEVIVGKDEGEEGVDWEAHYGAFRGQTCKRTSYNTQSGVHFGGGTPFRKNYAGLGYTYDAERDAFIPPKPFASWVLNESHLLMGCSCSYASRCGCPEKRYTWDENSVNWVEVQDGT
jgi:hypothetical protein